MNAVSIEDLLKKQYEMLGHGEVHGITEIRIIKTGKQIFCHNEEEFIDAATGVTAGDAYVGLNPRRTESGNASEVSHLTCLCIDIDPVREKETASTPEQHQKSLELGQRIVDDFKGGYIVSSGSGCHVYLPVRPIKVDNWEGLTESVKKWLDLVREKYAPKGKTEFKIDAIHDLPRVIRLWGSLNTRSNRLCGPTQDIGTIARLEYSFSQKAVPKQEKIIDTTELDGRFNFLVENNKRLNGIVNGTITYPSKSESDFEFVCILAKAHFSADEIKAVFSKNPGGNKEPKKGDVERIIKKVFEDDLGTVSFTHQSELYKQSLTNRAMGYRTGIKSYDELVSGIKRQRLYLFAARPGEGKTSLGVQIAEYLASTYGPVTYHPTEVGYEPIFDKIISRKGGLDLTKFQNGSFLDDDLKKIEKIIPEAQKIPLIIIQDFSLTVDKIEQDIKKYGPVVHFIDFFQALSWKDKTDHNEKYQAVKRIKQMAGDFNIPIVLMSQLARTKDKSTLASLSETKALEEYGDVITFIDTKERLSDPRKVYLDVQKSKYSATGLLRMDFHRRFCKFTEGIWMD